MERLTVDNPRNNREALLNYAYAKDGRVYLSYADGEGGVDLCEYIAKNACCEEIDAAASRWTGRVGGRNESISSLGRGEL